MSGKLCTEQCRTDLTGGKRYTLLGCRISERLGSSANSIDQQAASLHRQGTSVPRQAGIQDFIVSGLSVLCWANDLEFGAEHPFSFRHALSASFARVPIVRCRPICLASFSPAHVISTGSIEVKHLIAQSDGQSVQIGLFNGQFAWPSRTTVTSGRPPICILASAANQ